MKPSSVVALIQNEQRQILAVSRKDRLEDLGLIGGKIESSDIDPMFAVIREIEEETGLIVEFNNVNFIYERVDVISGSVAWCYRVHKWQGIPKAMEPNTWVGWVKPVRLLFPECTFRSYNRNLFEYLKLSCD